jgi:hypothetical protein
MTSPRRRARAALLGCGSFVAAFGLVACGEPDRLDPAVLERLLPGQIAPEHPEVVTDMVCPPRIDKRVGVVVECTAALAGAPVTVRVVQLDDNGAVRAELDAPLLDVGRSAAVLAARFTKDLGVSTTIECEGAPLRVLVVGEKLRCTARDPSLRSRVLVVTVLDAAATLDAQLG